MSYRVAGFSAILVLCVACAPTVAGGTDPVEPVLGAVSRPGSLADVVSPLERHVGTGPERHFLARAEDVLIRDCMRGLGLDWPVEPQRSLKVTMQAWDLGYLDPETVPTHGYHPPGLDADLAVSVGGPANGPRIVAGAQKAAYSGDDQRLLAGRPIPEGGCEGEAQRRLGRGGPDVDGKTVLQIANITGEMALADRRVIAVNGAWSECMKAKAFTYADPYESRTDERWNTGDSVARGYRASVEELEVATTDLACRTKVNYVGVRLAVLSAYQNQEITARQDFYDKVRAQHQQRMRNAGELRWPS